MARARAEGRRTMAVAAEQELGIIVWSKHLGMTATQVKEVLDQAS